MKQATRTLRRAALLAAAACSFACGVGAPVQPPPAISRAHFADVAAQRDESLDDFLPWAAEQRDLIIVEKGTRKLVLYRYGAPLRTYPVVLGRSPGRKLFEGDRRTPSGLYEITAMRYHAKYHRFMQISYPNDDDRANYRTALSSGWLPSGADVPSPRAKLVAGLGGLVGIHGTDKDDMNRLGINWTFGCVSLRNRDVDELYTLVHRGTMVVIPDDQQP
jgi:murein L,D-transpeptidase YafK